MKRLSMHCITLALALSLLSCEGGVDGKFIGEGQGKGGPIQVEVSLADGRIRQVRVLKHSETAGLAGALDTLAEQIVRTNSLDVDAVTGCTLTSNGFVEAVTAALASAGVTSDMLEKLGKAVSRKSSGIVEETHDVVVIGAGGAGFCAAIEARLAGADVVILEKLPFPGGNTLISGAEFAAPGNWIQQEEGIVDGPDQMAKDMLKGGDYKNDPELVRTVAFNALAGAVWLRDVVGVEWEDELMFFGGHSVKRSLIPNGASGQEIIAKQKAKADELGVGIFCNTKAEELLADASGRVTGVKASSGGVTRIFHAKKAVIIASGGFGSNVAMRVQYNPAIDASILSTNTVGSTGDGIVMAQGLGAGVTGMEYIQTYPICDPLTGTLLYFDDARLYGHTVIVNKEGVRFVEELGRRDEMSMAIKAQTGHCCYEIVDHDGFVKSRLQENHATEISYLYEKGLLVKSDTLAGVAEFFGIDATNLTRTLDSYNGYVDAGSDPEFRKRSLPSKVAKAPFYMIKAVPAVHHTMGGITIDAEARVIDTEGRIIEGLYAAGEVTGGVHGTNRLGSDALADITVFGRIAGRNAAR